MQANSTPTKIPVPFADSGTKNIIPIPSQIGVTPGAASFTTGFPPLTFTPIAAGGVPPFGADFNGVFNAITQALRWSNAGGQYVYDSDFATSVGGYPKGALLQRSTLDGFWLSTAENNTTDPDAAGAGWVDPLAGRLIGVRKFTTAGTSTYTPTAGTKSVVVEVVGGGGGAAATIATNASSVSSACGGGGGAYAVGRFTTGFSGASVTVGAGGAGAAVGNTAPGGNGGTSSFGALISAGGGYGGSMSTLITTTTGTSFRAQGGDTVAGANVHSALGGPSTYGLALGNKTAGGDGGSSGKGAPGPAGTGAPGVGGGNPGADATSAGTGGSGGAASTTVTSQKGGNGAPGEVIIWEYA